MHAPAILITLAAATPYIAGAFDPDFGTDFATITHANNPAWVAPPGDIATVYDTPRGSVGYEYRMATTEITTRQWLDFINVRTTRSNADAFFGVGSAFAGVPDPDYRGPGIRWIPFETVSNSFPVVGMSWREAAMFCNWMHNGRLDDPESFLDGAYDTSTFAPDFVGTGDVFTDQLTRSADAKYWLPSLDEHIKASYWQPPDTEHPEGRWWTRPNGSDTRLVPGLPGEGETISGAGLDLIGSASIPVGSFPDVQSPWGILDVSGFASEWLEGVFPTEPGPRARVWAGSTYFSNGLMDDLGRNIGAGSIYGTSTITFRLASAVPPPATTFLILMSTPLAAGRRRR